MLWGVHLVRTESQIKHRIIPKMSNCYFLDLTQAKSHAPTHLFTLPVVGTEPEPWWTLLPTISQLTTSPLPPEQASRAHRSMTSPTGGEETQMWHLKTVQSLLLSRDLTLFAQAMKATDSCGTAKAGRLRKTSTLISTGPATEWASTWTNHSTSQFWRLQTAVSEERRPSLTQLISERCLKLKNVIYGLEHNSNPFLSSDESVNRTKLKNNCVFHGVFEANKQLSYVTAEINVVGRIISSHQTKKTTKTQDRKVINMQTSILKKVN